MVTHFPKSYEVCCCNIVTFLFMCTILFYRHLIIITALVFFCLCFLPKVLSPPLSFSFLFPPNHLAIKRCLSFSFIIIIQK